MDTTKECEHLILERKLVEMYCPDFKMYSRYGIHFFSGWITTQINKYKLRLLLDKQHTYDAPRLFLVSPKVLYTVDGRSINSFGMSEAFHTEHNGPGGFIQISYAADWDASLICPSIIMRGVVWINAYEEHRRTGKDFFTGLEFI